ncbi:zinc-dependent alcohol dehydrogenase family protein [Domibacillus robiginosus]|uniref:zinc-dependent alcohol dehydrogenase family protein n=1 Tax=Domibacillus robiginosus TaxID=1071054 RepID=UPI00067DE537|nr:zinc-dependent alcohol dehydrogenase family protein [Domibacillus robiginosus]
MTYLAAEYQGEATLNTVEKTVPTLGEKDVLIRIEAATICGTDSHILAGHHYAKPPVVLGHEFSGYIEDVGSKVTAVKVGELVTVEPHIFCGNCKYCRIGKEHLCLEKLAFGVHLDGGMGQYTVVPERTVYKVPDGISPSVAALTENVGCCLHGIDRANIQQGDSIVILGGGFVGIVLAELGRMRGASKVVVAEPNEARRQLIEKRGFIALDPLNQNIQEEIMHMTNDLGADIVIEAAGRRDTAQQTLNLVGRGGTIMFFGVVPPEYTVSVSPNDVFKRELNIIGSAINPYAHHRSIELLKRLNLEELITHHFSLKDIHTAFEVAQKGLGLKVAIHPNRGDL